jgi:hypothetical protein
VAGAAGPCEEVVSPAELVLLSLELVLDGVEVPSESSELPAPAGALALHPAKPIANQQANHRSIAGLEIEYKGVHGGGFGAKLPPDFE